MQGRERVRTLSVQRPQPHTTNPWKEEKIKQETKKKEQIMPTGKHWLFSWNPPFPHHQTQSHRPKETPRGAQSFCDTDVLQWGGANECQWATKAPWVTCAGTYGKGNAPLKGCIGLILILNSVETINQKEAKEIPNIMISPKYCISYRASMVISRSASKVVYSVSLCWWMSKGKENGWNAPHYINGGKRWGWHITNIHQVFHVLGKNKHLRRKVVMT